MSNTKNDDSDGINTASSQEQQLAALPEHLAANLPLVHGILLLDDPKEYAGLSLSGRSRMHGTPSFEEFSASLDEQTSAQGNSAILVSPESVVASALKKAFRDNVCKRMNDGVGSMQPARELMLELHQHLRALVPNRKDLHNVLKDDAIMDTTVSRRDLIRFAIQAANALGLLESDARAETTRAWVVVAQENAAREEPETDQQAMSSNKFVVTSILYLLFKAELCESDKQDFYLSHVWAPELARIGPELERAAFEARHGSFADPNSAPASRQWLRDVAQKETSQDKNADTETQSALPTANDQSEAAASTRIHRHTLIRKAWVEDILFRGAGAPSLALPEIFYLDQQRFQSLRAAVRMAVAGSALALHACQAAGQSPTQVLSQPLEPSSPLDVCRGALVQAMGEAKPTEDEYQAEIGDAVVSLARYWKTSDDENGPPLTDEVQESLRSRTKKVLSAQDPVVALLDERMKTCFAQLMTSSASTSQVAAGAPTELRSGRSTSPHPPKTAVSRKDLFLKEATQLFCDKGLAFYASDLALAAWGALRIIELAIALYGEQLLELVLSREAVP